VTSWLCAWRVDWHPINTPLYIPHVCLRLKYRPMIAFFWIHIYTSEIAVSFFSPRATPSFVHCTAPLRLATLHRRMTVWPWTTVVLLGASMKDCCTAVDTCTIHVINGTGELFKLTPGACEDTWNVINARTHNHARQSSSFTFIFV